MSEDKVHNRHSDEKRQTMEREPNTRQGQLETPEHYGEEGPTGGEGRAGGTLQKDIGTRDEKKRATERPAGPTGVHKSDEKDTN